MVQIYPEQCPVGRTMNVIGDRWTVMILRDFFLLGPRRFQDLADAFPSLSPNTLSARLKHLEENGIVERHFYEERPPRAEYLLTKKGKELQRVMRELRNWGQKHKTD